MEQWVGVSFATIYEEEIDQGGDGEHPPILGTVKGVPEAPGWMVSPLALWQLPGNPRQGCP